MHATTLTSAAAAVLLSKAASALAVPAKYPTTGGGKNLNSSTGIPMPDDFAEFYTTYQENMKVGLQGGPCNSDNVIVRKSWDDLDEASRKDYVDSVNCLASKPSTVSPDLAPGARNRIDDFTYIHINQTNIIHNSGYLLPWHRLILWQFEEALINECGYSSGGIPYWDNARFSEDPWSSKVWDSSEIGFGGNGEFLPNNHGGETVQIPGLAIDFPLPVAEGTGGGCVQDGAFKDLQLNLGPVTKTKIDETNHYTKYGLNPNPRCLSRNWDIDSTKGVLTWGNATTIVASRDIAEFRSNVELLWHKNAHTTVGKEGADPFSPTNDPVFYLLHAQIDRLWATWQGQDLENRQFAIDGNRTFFGIPLDYAPDVPPSLATIEDTMYLNDGWEPLAKEGMPTTMMGRCYVYE